MDKGSLKQLGGIADILHEQNAQRLTAAQQALANMKLQRSELLQRPGEALVVGASDAASMLAQSKWGNSVETALPVIDNKIVELENVVDALTAKTRLSFSRVQGLESLSEKRRLDDLADASKRDEAAQDILVCLRRSSNS